MAGGAGAVTTIRIRRVSDPITQEITATGTSLAAAVSRGARTLLGAGRSLGGVRVDTHTHRWTWGVRDDRHELVVRESRSGPSGARGSTSRVALFVRVPPDVLESLDDYADRHHAGNRSAAVEALVRGTCAGNDMGDCSYERNALACALLQQKRGKRGDYVAGAGAEQR